jgi:hypothetical protein
VAGPSLTSPTDMRARRRCSSPAPANSTYPGPVDRHKIWRIVHNNHLELKETAPDGYRAVVDVYLLGRTEPVRLDAVQTTRDPDFPWVFLVPESDATTSEPRILVPEHHIQRIEVALIAEPPDETERERPRLGFVYQVIDDPG